MKKCNLNKGNWNKSFLKLSTVIFKSTGPVFIKQDFCKKSTLTSQELFLWDYS